MAALESVLEEIAMPDVKRILIWIRMFDKAHAKTLDMNKKSIRYNDLKVCPTVLAWADGRGWCGHMVT